MSGDRPDTIIEIVLDSGTIKLGMAAQFSDVNPCLGNISSLKNKLDIENGFFTLGQMTFSIEGRKNFTSLIQNNYLKNRQVIRKDGFIGTAYGSYTTTYTGFITDWKREPDILSITVQDDLGHKGNLKLPVESTSTYNYLDYSNQNVIDVMLDLLKGNVVTSEDNMNIAAARVNTTQFTDEKSTWFPNWLVQRVLIEPEDAKELLSQLQTETNSFIFFASTQINFKSFNPISPGETLTNLNDTYHINNITVDSGYNDYINKVTFYYDYDESNSDNVNNFESVYIVEDTASQGAGQWAEVKEKIIKSKWIKSYSITQQPTNITGVIIYHASKSNGAGSNGTLAYNNTNKTLTWKAIDEGTAGEAVKIDVNEAKSTLQLYSYNKDKYIRVAVITASLPGSDQTDSDISFTAISGSSQAYSIASKILRRYRDPRAIVNFDIDDSVANLGGSEIVPADYFTMTADDITIFGTDGFDTTQMMVLEVNPTNNNYKTISCMEAIFGGRPGFIGPSTLTADYDDPSADHNYAYISDSSNLLGAANDPTYTII